MFTDDLPRAPKKSSLLPTNFSPDSEPSRRQPKLARFLKLAGVAAAAGIVSMTFFTNHIVRSNSNTFITSGTANLCPQTDVLIPSTNYDLWTTVGKELSTDAFKDTAIDWLSGAIQVKYVAVFHFLSVGSLNGKKQD